MRAHYILRILRWRRPVLDIAVVKTVRSVPDSLRAPRYMKATPAATDDIKEIITSQNARCEKESSPLLIYNKYRVQGGLTPMRLRGEQWWTCVIFHSTIVTILYLLDYILKIKSSLKNERPSRWHLLFFSLRMCSTCFGH